MLRHVFLNDILCRNSAPCKCMARNYSVNFDLHCLVVYDKSDIHTFTWEKNVLRRDKWREKCRSMARNLYTYWNYIWNVLPTLQKILRTFWKKMSFSPKLGNKF